MEKELIRELMWVERRWDHEKVLDLTDAPKVSFRQAHEDIVVLLKVIRELRKENDKLFDTISVQQTRNAELLRDVSRLEGNVARLAELLLDREDEIAKLRGSLEERSMEKWAKGYDELNGAPENEEDR